MSSSSQFLINAKPPVDNGDSGAGLNKIPIECHAHRTCHSARDVKMPLPTITVRKLVATGCHHHLDTVRC